MITITLRLGPVQASALAMYVFDPVVNDGEFDPVFPGTLEGRTLAIEVAAWEVARELLIGGSNSADCDNDHQYRDAIAAVCRRASLEMKLIRQSTNQGLPTAEPGSIYLGTEGLAPEKDPTMTNMPIVRRAAARMSDADLRAILNSPNVHADMAVLEGRAREGLAEIVIACCDELQARIAAADVAPASWS